MTRGRTRTPRGWPGLIAGRTCSYLHPIDCRLSLDRLPAQSRRRIAAFAKQESGFTLVEVIVALAILAAGLGALLSVISDGLRRTSAAEKAARAASLAQSLIAEVGTSLPIRSEERAGQFSNGYRWRLKMSPYGEAKEREEWPVGIYTISTEVEWEEGAQRRAYTLTTLRTGPKVLRP